MAHIELGQVSNLQTELDIGRGHGHNLRSTWNQQGSNVHRELINKESDNHRNESTPSTQNSNVAHCVAGGRITAATTLLLFPW